MPSLDTLLESGILTQNSEHSVSAAMFSFQEQLTAMRFAKEINARRLSIEDSYMHFWSYEEDARLWKLPKGKEWRALLPAWKRILVLTGSMLDKSYAEKLVDIMAKSYSGAKRLPNRDCYNPFQEDYETILELAKNNENIRYKVGSQIVDEFLNSRSSDYSKDRHHQDRDYDLRLLRPLEKIRHYDPRLFDVMPKMDSSQKADMIYLICRIGHYEPRAMLLLDSGCQDYRVLQAIAAMIGKRGKFDPKLIEILKHKNDQVSESARIAILSTRPFDECIPSLLEDNSPKAREVAATMLGRTKHYDSRLARLLMDNDPRVRQEAERASWNINHSDEERSGLRHGNNPKTPDTASLSTGPKHSDAELLDMLWDKDDFAKINALHAIGKTGHYHPRILELTEQKFMWLVRQTAIETLGKLKHYDPALMGLLDDKSVGLYAAIMLGNMGIYDKRMVKVLSSLYKKSDELEASLREEEDWAMPIYNDADEAYDWADKSSVMDAMRKGAKESEMEPQLLRDVLQAFRRYDDSDITFFIQSIHNSTKPQGLNPTVKRMAA